MVRDLIPRLAERLLWVVPDLPGFGRSDMPSRDTFKYKFDNLTQEMDPFAASSTSRHSASTKPVFEMV